MVKSICRWQVSNTPDLAYAKIYANLAQFLIMMVLIFGVMYFLMIRPQQKKQKELVKFRNALEKGQKIVTAGGIYGTVKEVKEGYVLVEVDSNVAIRVDKNMVMRDPSDIATPAK